MANNFCRFLSNGYRFKSTGTDLTYQPCCWFSREISLIKNPDFTQQHTEISNINGWTPDCTSCRQIEESGAYGERSPRLRSFREIPDNSVPNGYPAWIELAIDITCNAACIMCGPWHSTTWRKQQVKFNIKTKDEFPDIIDPLRWLSVIKNKFSFEYVKSVSFLGGEPFESPIPLAVLKSLKEIHGSLNDVKVHFQTNGSIKPSDELMSLASECKLVKLNLSIDGTNERFEYIRYPIRWYKVDATVNYIRQLQLDNLKFVVLSTVNPFNIYYYDELEQWVEQTFSATELISFKPNMSVGNISLSQTPAELRVVVQEKFGSDHELSKLISNLPYSNTSDGVNYVNWLDQHRGTDWRQTFPNVVKFLDHI